MAPPRHRKRTGDSKKRAGSETPGPTNSNKKQKKQHDTNSGSPKAGPVLDLSTELPQPVETWINPSALTLFESVKVLSS